MWCVHCWWCTQSYNNKKCSITTRMKCDCAASPSVLTPYPTTGEGHWDVFLSNTVYLSRPAGDTPLPNLSQNSCVSSTSLWARTPPRTRSWLTATEARQTPGCWKSLGYSPVGSYRQSWGENRDGSCSCDSAQICCCRLNTRRTPRLLHSTDGLLHIWEKTK